MQNEEAAKMFFLDLGGSGARFGVALTVRQAFGAGGGGAPDDVQVIGAGDLPFAYRVVEAKAIITTVVAGSNVRLRDALGGGGNALSSALSSAVNATVRDASLAAMGAIPVGGLLTLRRSDNGVAGEVQVTIVRDG